MNISKISCLFLGASFGLVASLAIAQSSFVEPKQSETVLSSSEMIVSSTVLPIANEPRSGSRSDARRAWRDIGRAQEEAAQVAFLASQTDSAMAIELQPLAETLLNEAFSQHEAGSYREARETARAARDTFRAIQNLYEAELGFKVSSSGRPEAPSRSYLEAPYQVRGELARVEAEMNVHSTNHTIINDLMGRARELARPAESASVQPASNMDFRYLAKNRAAIRLSNAARRLISAEREIS